MCVCGGGWGWGVGRGRGGKVHGDLCLDRIWVME